MIVRMKKLTLFVSSPQRQEILVRLRRLGIVHIRNVMRPSADEIDRLEDQIIDTKRVISIFDDYRKDNARDDEISWKPSEMLQNLKEALSLAEEKQEALRALEDVKGKIEWFKPWGKFNVDQIQSLAKKDIFVRLYRVSKSAFRKVQDRRDINIINKDKNYVYLAQVSDASGEGLPLEETKLPQEGFGALYGRQESLYKRIDEIDDLLKTKAKAKDFLKAHLPALESRQTFLSTMHGMKKEEGFLYLQGFCPTDRMKDIMELSKSQGFGYLIEDPDNPEETPTLIRSPKWIKMIEPIFKFMRAVPGYNEYDISPWFLVFLSIFFAMLIGDAGYGLLFLFITFFAKKRLKTVPREPFSLMYLLSVATIIWGVITGTYFGLEKIAEIPFLNSLIIANVDSFIDTNQNFMIYLCFIIGVIHLTIAHLIIGFRFINTLKALAEAGWILILWGLFFTAGTLVIARPFPLFAGYLLGIGALLVLLFSSPRGTVPLKIISSFSDVVSYLRLFAVGYASVVVAASFNNMALEVGFDNVIAGLGAAFIIFFGHTLNILLGFMAVIVHGVRLNMLEFSGQMGMEWSGKEYDPFREKEAIGQTQGG